MDVRRMAANAWEEGQLGMNEVFSSFGNGGATNWKTLALNSSEQIQNLQKPKGKLLSFLSLSLGFCSS